jgi:hypothetical protein
VTVRIVSLMLSMSLLLLAGCSGGGQKANSPETTARTGTTVKITPGETTGAPKQSGQAQGKGASQEDYCIEKQFAESTQGMSQQEAANYETGIINEAVQRGVDPRTILNERGFLC